VASAILDLQQARYYPDGNLEDLVANIECWPT
jgi:hypothetical protein